MIGFYLDSKKSGHHIFDRQNRSRFLAKFLNVINLPGIYGVKSKKDDLAKFFDSKNNFLTQDFPVSLFSTLFPSHHTPRATRQNL